MNRQTRLHGETDAQVWAKEFVQAVAEHPGIPTDKGCMIGWFANAIMAGFDEAKPKNPPNVEFIVLPRDALLQFFGEVAMPPGSGAPYDTECAPIANKVISWLESHDLTEVYLRTVPS